MEYTVRSHSKRHRFQIEPGASALEEITVVAGRKTFSIRIHSASDRGEPRIVSVNNKIYSIQVRRRPDGFPYKVILNGRAYPVEIERVESTRYKPPLKEKKVDGRVLANLPGQIVRVLVDPDEEVKKGDPVIVLEAMKMENEIAAPCDGKVKTVLVETSQVVSKGDLLLEITSG